jgi:hypothetical protein
LKDKLKKAAKKAANIMLLGGIAADIIKSKQDDLDSSAPNASPGEDGKAIDIAASGSDETNDNPSPKEGRPDMGGLAAMAAAAAAKRGKNKKNETPNIGNLAAMAAKAASKRERKNVESSNVNAATSSDSQNAPIVKPANMGGIAAMAAAAAAKREAVKQEGSNPGSIAAMAAIAALSRGPKVDETSTETTPNTEGILGEKIGSPEVAESVVFAPAAAVFTTATSKPADGRETERRNLNDSETNREVGQFSAATSSVDMSAECRPSTIIQNEPEETIFVAGSGSANAEPGSAITPGPISGHNYIPSIDKSIEVEHVTPLFTDPAEKNEESSAGELETATSAIAFAENGYTIEVGANGGPATMTHDKGYHIELANQAAPKKRSSSDDDCGDDNSSGGESTSSKKLKPSPHLNTNNSNEFLDCNDMNEDDVVQVREYQIAEADESLRHSTSVATPSLEINLKDMDNSSNDSCEKSGSPLDRTVNATETQFHFEVSSSSQVAFRQSQPESIDDSVSISEHPRKVKSQKDKKKRKKKSHKSKSNREGSVTEITTRELPSEIFPPNAVEKVGSPHSSGSEREPTRSRENLSPLRSEVYTRGRRHESDDTFESFFETLEDEIAAADGITIREDRASTQGDNVTKSPKPSQASNLEPGLGSSDRSIQRNDSGNPLQRWMQSVGGSKDFSEDHGSKGQLGETPPTSPKKSSKEKDNVFASFFRQLSGRDQQSANSLATESVTSTIQRVSSPNDNESGNEAA